MVLVQTLSSPVQKDAVITPLYSQQQIDNHQRVFQMIICSHLNLRENFQALMKPFDRCKHNCRQTASKWMCLTCMQVHCGREAKNKCAEMHYKKAKHYVSINSTGSMVWCYQCDSNLLQICDYFESNEDEIVEQESKKRLAKFSRQMEQVKKAFFNNVYLKRNPPKQKEIKDDSSQMEIEIQLVDEYDEYTKIKAEDYVFGLNNIGNTCFFNSTMQCLNAAHQLCDVYLIKKQLLGGKMFSPFKRKELLIDLDDITPDEKKQIRKPKRKINQKFREFLISARRSRVHNPSQLFRSICQFRSTFASMAQQDAQELLRFLLEGMAQGEDQLLRVDKTFEKKYGKHRNNFVENVFGGYLASHLYCVRCKHNSWTYDFIMDLSLEIPSRRPKMEFPESFQITPNKDNCAPQARGPLTTLGKVACPEDISSLEGCLYHFFAPQKLTKQNYFICSKCKVKDSTGIRKFYLYLAPPILTITLKRFKGMFQKNNNSVRFMEELTFQHVLAEGKPRPILYRLFGITVHQGGYGGGHYISYVKHGGRWFCYSDSSYKEVSWTNVSRAQAYILFYRRSNHCKEWLQLQ